jgi:hypothetical protein
MKPITIDEILAELGPPPDVDGWYSTTELAQAWGISKSRTDAILKKAFDAELLESQSVKREDRSKRLNWCPVYRFKVKPCGKKK